MKFRRSLLLIILLLLTVVSGWQYALLRNFPRATAISDLIPSPDGQCYATILHLQTRLPLRPIRDVIRIEVGRGSFDQQPEIIYTQSIPIKSVDLKALAGKSPDRLIRWRPDSTAVHIQLNDSPQIISMAPSEATTTP